METRTQQTEAASSQVIYVPVAPRTPGPFYGDPYEYIDDWVQQYERAARHNGWTPDQFLQNVYFALEGTARYWYENHEASITSWDQLKAELRRTFANLQRRERTEELLQTRTQGPNESVTSFVEDVQRLSTRADPQASDERKLRVLMRGVRADIFGGLVRNPPKTVDEFFTEATNIERALAARAGHYNRLAISPAVPTFASTRFEMGGVNVDHLRDIIREVVREEVKKLSPAADAPTSLSVAEVVREEVQRSFHPEPDVVAPCPEELTVSYAAMVPRSPPPSR